MQGLTINQLPNYGGNAATTPKSPVELPKSDAQTTTTNTATNPMTTSPTTGCTDCKKKMMRNVIIGVLLVVAIGAGYFYRKPIMTFFKKSPVGE
jgi:hypothetical protein